MPRYLISRQISDILCLKFFILPIKPLFYIFHQPKYFSSSKFRNFDRLKKIKIDGLISQFFSVFSSFWLLNTTFLCLIRKVSKWALIYAQKQQKLWNYIKHVIFSHIISNKMNKLGCFENAGFGWWKRCKGALCASRGRDVQLLNQKKLFRAVI